MDLAKLTFAREIARGYSAKPALNWFTLPMHAMPLCGVSATGYSCAAYCVNARIA